MLLRKNTIMQAYIFTKTQQTEVTNTCCMQQTCFFCALWFLKIAIGWASGVKTISDLKSESHSLNCVQTFKNKLYFSTKMYSTLLKKKKDKQSTDKFSKFTNIRTTLRIIEIHAVFNFVWEQKISQHTHFTKGSSWSWERAALTENCGFKGGFSAGCASYVPTLCFIRL